MTANEVEIVQRTWRAVQAVGDTATELFYGKLFSLDPSLQKLFHGEAKDQGRNLTAMISVVVGSLSRPERVVLAVQQLGRRHAAYGVQARHFELARTALLWMLEQVLEEAYTPLVGAAWGRVYDFLAATMRDGFSPPTKAPRALRF